MVFKGCPLSYLFVKEYYSRIVLAYLSKSLSSLVVLGLEQNLSPLIMQKSSDL